MKRLMPDGFSGRNVRVRQGQWHFRFKSGGQECSGSTGLPATKRNQKRAEAYADDERAKDRHAGRRENIGFAEAAGEFVAWCRDVEYRGKQNTAHRIKTSFASIVEFFGCATVGAVGAAQVEAYKSHRLSTNRIQEITLRHDLHALSLFFQYAGKMKWATANPVKEVSIPSDRDAIREHVVTAEEEDEYFAAAEALHLKYAKSFRAAQPNLSDVARLILEQGARPEEIMAARQEHLNAKGGTLLIAGGKTRAARRLLHLTEASAAILARRSQLPGPWLFPSDRNPGHHITKLACSHDRACREAGVSFCLYDLRHTFATRQIEAGTPVGVLAAIMGHSGLRTIHRYVHPTGDAQKRAMANYEAVQKRGQLKVVG